MYQKSVLSNGIRVVTDRVPYVRSITLGIWVGSGSRQEDHHQEGISHFIEHLMFKGTDKRSAKEIAEQIDEMGGQINAFTAKEYTCYYIKILDTHLETGMDVLSDMLLHSRHLEEEIVREREVVLEEYDMYEDSPDELIHDAFVNTIWQGHQLGRNILGTRESISQFNRELVLEYLKDNYLPDNIVVAASGNLTHEKIVEVTERFLGSLQGEKRHQALVTPQYKPDIRFITKQTEQVHLCLGAVSVPIGSPDIYAINILSNIFGGSASSRLFQSIREERGLAYSIYSYQSNHLDSGLMSVYAGTRPKNCRLVIDLIIEAIGNLRKNPVSAKELTKAKEQLKGSILLGLESSSGRMSRLGKLEVTMGKYISPEQLVEHIDAVTTEKLQEIVESLFIKQPLSLVAIGPVEKGMLPDKITI